MSDHTKGELKIGGCGFERGSDYNKTCNLYIGDKLIATLTNEDVPLAEAEVNAERFIRSWNRDDAFDELLAACVQAERLIHDIVSGGDELDGEIFDSAIAGRKSLRDAIARATPQPETTEK